MGMVGFLLKIREKGKGVGRVGGGVGTASQCARVFQNYPLANYPLVSPRHWHSGPPKLQDSMSDCQDQFDHDKGQKSAISGRRLHWRLSTGFFVFFSPVFMCNLVR